MSHDWIYEVLRDIARYARANNLPALAAKADEALMIAEVEIPALEAGEGSDAGNGGGPSGRPH